MKIKPKNLLGMMMTIVLIFSSSTILYKHIITTVQDNLDLTVKELREEQFNTVWSSLLDFQEQAKQDVDVISSKIENDIYSLSDDELKQLNYDMDNNIFNEKYHNILISNIEDYKFNKVDNHQNGIVIMNTNGYVEDFNYRRAQNCLNDEHMHNSHLCREWGYSVDHSYNKELEKDAIDKLLNRTSGIIATESYNITHINNHIMIDELTHETLLNVFKEEGVNGLRNYQIFIPHYITNVGDIFGTPDITHGVKLDNHKIIVVLEFNLYDQLANKYPDYENIDIDELIYRTDNLLRWLYIFGIVTIVTVVILILYLCSVYNELILREINNEEIESENIESKL